MTKEQQKFVAECIAHFTVRDKKKYKVGQKEHGGDFWKKSGLLNEGMNETLDQWNYLYAVKFQIQEVALLIRELNELDLTKVEGLSRNSQIGIELENKILKLLATKCI